MKSKLKNILIFVGLGVLLLGGALYLGNQSERKLPIHAEIFVVDKGFGYRILHQKKLLIQQESVPAIQGSHPFTSAVDAEKTADLVIDKLLNGEDPRLSIEDLERLEVHILKTRY
ncbi:DUF4907 domain-containing protein [Maribacter sp. ANRC-HE7]|uniref:DUF4907 domain-containing protein n=1 Tax=Maribacter aquimaris TaxID=2737171 RepID=A0ABR7V044_9FLAO|nr:DUF4907 domain-containing protein [Maribacter aquimaris]MBD0777926.1 DUF4907 domain-containing protein [Maribacter aquimaris]